MSVSLGGVAVDAVVSVPWDSMCKRSTLLLSMFFRMDSIVNLVETYIEFLEFFNMYGMRVRGTTSMFCRWLRV